MNQCATWQSTTPRISSLQCIPSSLHRATFHYCFHEHLQRIILLSTLKSNGAMKALPPAQFYKEVANLTRKNFSQQGLWSHTTRGSPYFYTFCPTSGPVAASSAIYLTTAQVDLTIQNNIWNISSNITQSNMYDDK